MLSSRRLQFESLLQEKRLDGTLVRPWQLDAGAVRLPSGLPRIDAALGGGWRRGEISEIVGPRSSGRTSVLAATLASATSRGEVVGVVDAVDRFDPASAAAAGVALDRVLWARGPGLTAESARPDSLARAVRQALRAFDLIVRAGGFGVVALDVADVPTRYLRALPWTTWLRLAHAIAGRDTVGLLVGEAPVGRSARGATTQLSASRRWSGTSAQGRRFDGLDLHVRTGGAAPSTSAAHRHDLLPGR